MDDTEGGETREEMVEGIDGEIERGKGLSSVFFVMLLRI